MPLLADNTMNLRQSVIEEIREQQQPLLEWAGRAEEFDDRVTTVEGETAAIVPTVEQVASRVIDVREFGPIGTADDTDTFVAALASGPGIVTSPADGHRFTKGFTVPPGRYLQFNGSGATELDFRDMTDPVNGAAIYGEGARSALPALASPIALRATTITFASVPDVQPGDWLQIANPADSSFSSFRTYYRAGENVRVKSVSGTTVTLTSATYDAYPATVTVRKVMPWRGAVRGARMTLREGLMGALFLHATGQAINDLVVSGSNQHHVRFDQGYGLTVEGLTVWDRTTAGTTNYGLGLVNCQDVDVITPHLSTTRHGLAITGADVDGAVPNRNITIHGGTIDGDQVGADIHGNSEWITYVNVNMPGGIVVAGDHTRVRGGRIRNKPGMRAIAGRELLGWDHHFEDVDIDVTSDMDANLGVVSLEGTAGTTRTDGVFRFRGTVNQYGYTPGQGVVHVYNNGGAAANDVEIDLTVPTSQLPATGTDWKAAAVRAAAGGGFRDVRVSVRAKRLGVLIACSPRTAVLDGCELIEPPRTGLDVIYIGTPAYASTTVISRDNYVYAAGQTGIYYYPHATAGAAGLIQSTNDTAIDCNASSAGAGNNGASITLRNALDVVYQGATVGDRRGTQRQTHADVVQGAGTLYEEPAAVLGAALPNARLSVGTHRTRGAWS